MIVGFENEKFKRLVNQESKLIQKFGKRTANQIYRKIDILDSAERLSDVSYMPPTRLHMLSGTLAGYFAIDVTKQLRLIFRGMNHKDEVVMRKEEITHILIREVVDYHD